LGPQGWMEVAATFDQETTASLMRCYYGVANVLLMCC
jgi:hypothetical protein